MKHGESDSQRIQRDGNFRTFSLYPKIPNCVRIVHNMSQNPAQNQHDASLVPKNDHLKNQFSAQTLSYYSQNADSFSKSTQNLDFSCIQDIFISFLAVAFPHEERSQIKILDLGCGAGRDSKYFLEHGFSVSASDGSEEMCKIASRFTGLSVRHQFFEDLSEISSYEGIWACSSILHLPKPELIEVISKIHTALLPNGIFYASFKYGTFEGIKNGRYFTNLTEKSLHEILSQTKPFKNLKLWVTSDKRPERENEKWLNVILQKT